jgi:hypothetical protein
MVSALDPLSGITNTNATLSVISKAANSALSIAVNSSSLIANTTYLIGSSAILLKVPSYLAYPSYVNTSYFYSLVQSVGYAQVVVDANLGYCVRIYSTNPLDFGLHTLSLKSVDEFSGLYDITTFNVTLTCVRAITPNTAIND